MTNHSIIRKGVRALCVSLLAATLCAAWPLAAQAKGNGPHVSSTSGKDKVSGGWNVKQNTAAAKGKTKGNKVQYLQYEMHDTTISSYK